MQPSNVAAEKKVFNDPIHGHMTLHPLLVKIIDTPQFQRLRYIKQLGGAYFVYPGASHNRFEHSIGVGYLAGVLAKALKTNQPELGITDRDILCVEIAGLCHDLGHGPFSHLFERTFIPRTEQQGRTWKHEEASLDMFDHLVKSNKLKSVMEKYGLKPKEDLIFIKEMMHTTDKGKKEGRPEDKSFLYEIVANKTTGIDVDKFDYFARDCHHLGIKNNFDHNRYIMFARVCEVEEDQGLKRKHICLRDKEEDNMTEMFHTRYSLHKKAYQHRVNKIIEVMIADALLKANNHIQIEGSDRMVTLSEAIDDMEAYTKLTDSIFEQILNSTSTVPEMVEAKKILCRVVDRDLYKFLGETRVENHPKKDEINDWKQELTTALSDNGELQPGDFEVTLITLNYGMEDEDPIEKLYFYSKYDTTNVFKKELCQRSKIRPKCFQEHLVRFYLKKTDSDPEAVRGCFNEWCRTKGFPEYQE